MWIGYLFHSYKHLTRKKYIYFFGKKTVRTDSYAAPTSTTAIGASMDGDLLQRITSNPQYIELKTKRSRFGWQLTLAMMLVYYGFIMLVAFDKEFLAKKLGQGVTTLGIPIGFGVIVFTIVITAIYVRRANTEFDELSNAVTKAVLK
jgi:uncharacterized membrane protein (DUF485 family)